MNDEGITIYWPAKEGREEGVFFYGEATEAYLPNSHVRVAGHGDMIMLGSYSYLGLNGDERINQAAQEAIAKYGTGTLGVRLLAGTLDLHRRLEERIARFKGAETAVVSSSGFLANISTICAIVGRSDVVICDKLDHASIVDGCRLCGADVVRFRHNDMLHLERRLEQYQDRKLKLVVVDAVFSMDGDIINLPEVSRLCRKYGALLMVDEAHSIGVLGETGHGIEEHFGLPPDSVDIKMGTFSKAIPSNGGYVATREGIADAIRLNGRGYIYSASLAPASAAAACAALDIIEAEPERVRRLHDNMAHFAARLTEFGVDFRNSPTAIFPIMCGDDWSAYRLAHYCHGRGVYVQAIPHPVVPKGSARLRACTDANLRKEQLDYCATVIRDGADSLGLFNGREANQRAGSGNGNGNERSYTRE
ncbi:MAG: 8-amino-7-oxononanoate synthase [Candidatus Hydrogenedentota bacterium]